MNFRHTFLAVIALIASPALANPPPLEEVLKDFDRNPQKFMNQRPYRWGGDTEISKFSVPDVQKKEFIKVKSAQRKLRGRAAIQGNDKPENLVDNGRNMIRSLEAMNKKRLTSAKLPKQPWSDYYWSLFAGQTAFRYADAKFPGSDDWKVNADFIRNERNFSSIDTLSPAEKYDLLVGDERKTLTRSAIGEGEDFYRSTGKVERWMGLCHGWAAAAYMMDRPKNAIKVMAADGRTMIKFFPSDIKALTTLLWAKFAPGEKFIGGRCNVKDPKMSEAGRVIDQDCFDTNPGAWHLAVVNQIGVSKRSMILDATYDYEVWNQPIVSYEYEYFNPQTLRPARTLKEAMVPIEKFSKDKFKKFRAKNAEYVVGISMNMDYVVENLPSTNAKDGPSQDSIKSVQYQYDLELDEDGNIIGGEWYTNLHPDFLWTPEPDSKAWTPGDDVLARFKADKLKWNGNVPMPEEWLEVAKRNSEGGAPLAVVVESLIKLSNGINRL